MKGIQWLIVLIAELQMQQQLQACISSGICGGLYGCTPPIPPVAPVCVGGCGFGYSCGPFGCFARARARSSKTFKVLKAGEGTGKDIEVISLKIVFIKGFLLNNNKNFLKKSICFIYHVFILFCVHERIYR